MLRKISIIITVYNCEKYLRDCIYSIINQTYRNLEIIVINDGSTDNSGKICDDFSKYDKRIKVFHKENSGVSSSRNIGLSMVTGNYITFVDADDYLKIDTYELAVKSIENGEYDLLAFDYNIIYTNKNIKNNKDDNEIILSPNEAINMIFSNKYYRGFCCNKIYKAYIIKENHLRFNEKINIFEDIIFNINYLNCCKNIKYIREKLYNYRIRKNSATMNINYTNFINSIKSIEIIEKLIKDKNLDFIKFKYRNNILAHYYLDGQNKKYVNKDELKKLYNKEIKKNRSIKMTMLHISPKIYVLLQNITNFSKKKFD